MPIIEYDGTIKARHYAQNGIAGERQIKERIRRQSFMRENTAKFVTVNALAIALVCVSTMAIQIPIPLGYMHLGNTCILLMAVLFGPMTGFLAGGIGSAFADLLTGYTQWVLPTLIIKCLMGFVIGRIACGKDHQVKMASVRTLCASVAGIAVMVFGYFAAGAVMNGSIYTGLLQVPGLTFEGVLGAVLFYIVGAVLEKAHVERLLQGIRG